MIITEVFNMVDFSWKLVIFFVPVANISKESSELDLIYEKAYFKVGVVSLTFWLR